MPFTSAQVEAVKAALGKYLRQCPVCQHNQWLLNSDINFLPSIEGKAINVGRGQPCVSAVCTTCGSVQLFNAYTMGLGETLGLGKAGGDAGQP